MNVDRYAKAITSAVLAGLFVAELAISDNTITGVEWVRIAIAVVSSYGLVYLVPNAPNDSGRLVYTPLGDRPDPAPPTRRWPPPPVDPPPPPPVTVVNAA